MRNSRLPISPGGGGGGTTIQGPRQINSNSPRGGRGRRRASSLPPGMRPLPITRPSILKVQPQVTSYSRNSSSSPEAVDSQDEDDEDEEINDSGFYQLQQQRVQGGQEEQEAEDCFPLPGMEFQTRRSTSSSTSLLNPLLIDWKLQFNKVTETNHKFKLTHEYKFQIFLESLFLKRCKEILDYLNEIDRSKFELDRFQGIKDKTNKILLEKQKVLINNNNNRDYSQLERQKTIQQLLSKLNSISKKIYQQKQSTLETLSIIDSEIEKKLSQQEFKFKFETDQIRENFHSWGKGNGLINTTIITNSTTTTSGSGSSSNKLKNKKNKNSGTSKTKTKTITKDSKGVGGGGGNKKGSKGKSSSSITTTTSKGKKNRASTGSTGLGKRKNRSELLTTDEEEEEEESSSSSADNKKGGGGAREKRRKTG